MSLDARRLTWGQKQFLEMLDEAREMLARLKAAQSELQRQCSHEEAVYYYDQAADFAEGSPYRMACPNCGMVRDEKIVTRPASWSGLNHQEYLDARTEALKLRVPE